MFRQNAENVLKLQKQRLKKTKSVYYFISSASRPAITQFYDQLIYENILPKKFPHNKLVHSGIFIYNHQKNQVEDVIEGAGDRKGNLVLYRNRQSTINKLENSGVLPGENKEVNVYGNWKDSYQIKMFFLTNDFDLAKTNFDKFFIEFKTCIRRESYPLSSRKY